MSDQRNFLNLLSATSSQELASGATHSGVRDGTMTDRSGRDPVRASLSAGLARERGLLTSGTYSQTGSTSSASAALQRSLENRLRVKTALVGSTLYKLTWKERATPLHRSICALRASVRRTSGNDYGSWATPTTRDHKGGYQGGRIRNGKISTDTLDVAAQLTGWPTPNATNNGRGEEPDAKIKRGMNAGLNPSGRGEIGGMDNTIGIGRDAGRHGNYGGDVRIEFDATVEDGSGAKTNGVWRDADWLYCRDGKWRPVEPSTFPLANGIAGRVGRCRAYGNAIVSEVAQGLISSFMERENGRI